MEPSRELIDDLYRDKVRAARAMPPEQKLLAGAELFDWACSITMSGIRAQHPEASEERVLQILRDRLAWAERWEATQ
jgi:hypothetical protein